MQYVGQIKHNLNERFREHFNKMKKPKQIDSFLYKHFSRAGNSRSPDKIMLQPVEEMIFYSNSTERYKNIFRHETEIKWIKALQTPFPLGFNDTIYHEGNISKKPDFGVFSLLDIRRRNRRSRGKRKNGNLKRKQKNKLFGHLQIYGRS